MAVGRALLTGLVGTVIIGFLFLVFSLLGDTTAEDSRTCREALYLQGIYIDKYVNTPDEKNYWIAQADFAQQLSELSGRKISVKLNNALVDDAIEINNSKKFLPTMQATINICN
jgi:hypothetical protein